MLSQNADLTSTAVLAQRSAPPDPSSRETETASGPSACSHGTVRGTGAPRALAERR